MDENKELINVIQSRLVDLENEIEEMSGNGKKLKDHMEQKILLKKFFTSIIKIEISKVNG